MSGMINQYQHNQIATASPEQILLMLYDGAIRFTRQAMAGIDNNNMTDVRHGISKTLAMVTEFAESLDHEIGGKIAEDLDALYNFMIKELLACNIKTDRTKLEGVEKLLVDLRSTWGEAVVVKRKEEHAAAQAVTQPTQVAQPTAMATAYGGGRQPSTNGLQQSYSPLSISG